MLNTVALPDGLAALAKTPLLLDEAIVDLLPAAVSVCDAEGVVVRFNRKAAELWGRLPPAGDSAEPYFSWLRAFWPDARPVRDREAPLALALRTGRPQRNVELQIEQPNGRRMWILADVDPIHNGAGEIVGALDCFRDITARKQADYAMRESEELLRAVVETTPECVKVVRRDGTLLHINPAGLRIVEAGRPADIEGASVFDLIAPGDRAAWREHHERVCNGERLSWGFELVGLRGARRHMETQAAPLRMPDGTVAQLAITRDVTRHKRNEAALRETEQRARELLQAIPAAVYTTDAAGRITFFNQACVTLAGRTPEIGTDHWCVSWRLYRPDGAPLPHAECPMAVALKENRAIAGAEIVAERPDGARLPVLAYPTPLRDSAGRVAGAVNMLVDISERQQAEERRQLLLHELNHRVKNTLAMVQSIASQSFKGEARTEAFGWFEERVMALARAHDVLTRQHWEGADLRDIVAQATAPLCGQDGDRFSIRGPGLKLTPKQALSLAMALHELCTNAAKHGALSNGEGKVAIAWEVARGGAGGELSLHWAESGGPPVRRPGRKGFGSRLIEQGLARELGARVRLDYAPSGLRCDIRVPLS